MRVRSKSRTYLGSQEKTKLIQLVLKEWNMWVKLMFRTTKIMHRAHQTYLTCRLTIQLSSSKI